MASPPKRTAAELRQQAEKMFQATPQVPEDLTALTPEAVQRTLHELRVHQIQLEMQNVELLTAQAQLDAARARYFDLYDLAPVGYVTVSEQGQVLEANLTAATLLGVARSALVKQRLSQFIVPEDQDIYYRHRQQLCATDAAQVFELRMMSKAGAQFWARLDATAALACAAGQVATAARVCRMVMSDITGQKRAAEDLQLFKTAVEHSNEACAICDATGRLIYINKAHEQLFGLSLSEARARNLRDCYPPESVELWNQQIMPLLERGESWVGELEVFDAAGRRFTLWQRADAIRDARTNMLRYCFGFMHDTTERKRLEAQHRQRQKSESLSHMAGAIAHHFNNQLMAVMGNLELAMENVPQDAELFATLADAMHSASQAAEVSRLMLTYAGQTPGAYALVDLSAMCRRHLPALSAGMPKHICVEFDLPAPGPTVFADENQIRQVLANLLTNAWEAGGDGGGTIRVTVTTMAATAIPGANRFPIDSQPHDTPYACLTVADTGCGIAVPDIEKIFDPFFSSKGTGRGLGLPTVLGIVRAHEGFITVASQPGQGSTFRVFLPLSRPGRKIMPSPVAAGEEGGRPVAPSGTVLLVEGDAAVRKVAAGMLARLGFVVLVAQDGSTALELFRQRQAEIRCVLCDLTMPGMDGWATLTALRQIAPSLPVILASGYDEAQAMTVAHPELPQTFLVKPFQMQALRDALAKAMAGK